MSKRDYSGGRKFSYTRSQRHVRRSNSSWQPGHTWPQPSNMSNQKSNRPRHWVPPHQQADPAVRAGQGQKARPRRWRATKDSWAKSKEEEGVGAVVVGDGV